MAWDFDLLVVGSGPGGLAAAQRAAGHGLRVAVVGDGPPGGACVHHSCIPEALTRYAASFGRRLGAARHYGWQVPDGRLDWPTFCQQRAAEIDRLARRHAALLEQAGITLIQGRGRLSDPHTVSVADRSLTASHLLLAVGAIPDPPAILGGNWVEPEYRLLVAQDLPRRVVLVGDHYHAARLAGILLHLDVEVTQITEGEAVVGGVDGELSRVIGERLVEQGLQHLAGVRLAAVRPQAQQLEVVLAEQAETLLATGIYACGRWRPATADLGLTEAGVRCDARGAIVVDETFLTSASPILAVGDCTSRSRWLTPAATHQARLAVDMHFGGQPAALEEALVPVALSHFPEAATVGLGEEAARARFGDAVRCFRQGFVTTYDSLAKVGERSFVKLVTCGAEEQVIGAHMVGRAAAEIVQMLAAAMRLGVRKRDLEAIIGIHPSSGEEFLTLS